MSSIFKKYKKASLLIALFSTFTMLTACSVMNDEDIDDEDDVIIENQDDIDTGEENELIDDNISDSVKSVAEILRNNDDNEVMLVSHRGFCKIAPENTISSYECAAEYGSDMIELDVQMTKDNCVVIFHDNNMYRITGMDAFIGDYTYDELREISAGQWFVDEIIKEREKKEDSTKSIIEETKDELESDEELPEIQEDELVFTDEVLAQYSAETFPTLRESLAIAKENGMGVDIEIKTLNNTRFNGWECKWFVSQVVAQVNEYDMADSVIFSSFNYDYLKQVEAMNSDYYTMFIADMNDIDILVNSCDTDAVALTYNNVQGNAMDRLHQSGKDVYVWVIDDEEEMKQLVKMGAEGIITNDTELGYKTIK